MSSTSRSRLWDRPGWLRTPHPPHRALAARPTFSSACTTVPTTVKPTASAVQKLPHPLASPLHRPTPLSLAPPRRNPRRSLSLSQSQSPACSDDITVDVTFWVYLPHGSSCLRPPSYRIQMQHKCIHPGSPSPAPAPVPVHPTNMHISSRNSCARPFPLFLLASRFPRHFPTHSTFSMCTYDGCSTVTAQRSRLRVSVFPTNRLHRFLFLVSVSR